MSLRTLDAALVAEGDQQIWNVLGIPAVGMPKLYNPSAVSKIAGFDMDWTIIKTKSGSTFPKNAYDWELLYGEKTSKKLQDLYKAGYNIVIFTNQAGVEIGKTKIADLKIKFNDIQKKVGVPMHFMASLSKESKYRKPKSGMWDYFAKEILKGKVDAS